MGAPGGVELDEEVGVVFEDLREVGVVEGHDSALALREDEKQQRDHDDLLKHLNFDHTITNGSFLSLLV